MSPILTGMVLLAALLHAAWNALLKSGDDRFRAITIMSVASGLACLPALFVLPSPARACWVAIAISASVHVAYNWFLAAAYAHGDLGQVYPIARGSSPLLVTIGAAALAGEVPTVSVLLGIGLVSVGIIALARGWTRVASRRGLVSALATGALIAAYTVTDGLGARLSGAPTSYASWLFVVDAVPMPLIYWIAHRDGPPLFEVSKGTLQAAAGGIVSLLAYGIVIVAATMAPLGTVSALRETSVVFAALIGRIFLAEALPLRRFTACVTVGVGAILLTTR